MDDVILTINSKRYDLWRAVDQDGNIRGILVRRWRDRKAAEPFFRKRLKGCQSVPRVIITDQLKSDGAAQGDAVWGGAPSASRSEPSR